MSDFKRAPVAGGPPRQDGLSTWHPPETDAPKSVLSAEIISIVLDCLSIPDLLRFARVSKRMQEMVYDDTRWVQRLRIMGVWNEAEARKRFEEGMRRKWEAQRTKQGADLHGAGNGPTREKDGAELPSITLFDAALEEERRRQVGDQAEKVRLGGLTDGFDAIGLSSKPSSAAVPSPDPSMEALGVFLRVRSARGHARQEYGKIYGALAPFYFDLARSKTHNDPAIFRTYREPEHQAEMLAQLKIFSRSDLARGSREREEKLNGIFNVFETAVLREFEQGIVGADFDGRMRKYAHVLAALNGGQTGVQLFVKNHPLFSAREELGNPMDCIHQASTGSISLTPSHDFFNLLSSAINEQSNVIGRVFPPGVNVIAPFLDRVSKDILSEYTTPLFDETHRRNTESYLKAVAGIYHQSLRFANSLIPPHGSEGHFPDDVDKLLGQVFEPHVDLYLQQELAFFKDKCDAEVAGWECKLSAQDASTEAFFMANVNRQADKRDFLSSFKKVVMMPVNILPPFSSSKPPTSASSNGNSLDPSHDTSSQSSTRPGTPAMLDGNLMIPGRSKSPAQEAPTTELAAKAAIMNTKLEGIRSLFSIEVALNLVHAAKSSLERAALFVRLGGHTGESAKVQSLTIFVLLLNILGSRHIRPGFDTAVAHLGKYNPREVSEHSQPGVAPLVTFLELVNVGDLIQQMVDVFYEQELVATKLADRNDFLDPAVKEKKRFEQMLDERVAAGLNKGIDVLMDEVEYLCATTQTPTDFNPDTASGNTFDIGPSQTARQIVEVVEGHTKMLVGSTDKTMLDVFNQEVGLRLFTALCKHLKRQRISVDGSIKLI
ncbi:MAG: F-box protein: endocytic membrane traffic, recycling ReCYcling 1, partial [Thelocarpon impressellum]